MGEIQRASELIRPLSLSITLFLGALMGLLLGLSFYFDWPYALAVPAVLAVVYFALYHMNALFLAVVFFTPLSINIEEYVEHFGLYIPTEPLLFGIMLLLLCYQLKSGILEGTYFKHPLVILLFVYLAWIVICSVTSTHPIISFKSILARLWFIIPVFLFGPVLLNTERMVNRFFWALTIGTAIVIIYTVTNHASYGFGEKESHWVMSPFYKDHTIYGAAVALVVPFPIMLYLKNKQTPLVSFILVVLFLIILIGLYFSYTRAAWLSVLGALAIVGLVVFRIKFKVIFPVGLVVLMVLLFNVDKLQMELARNKTEHTTEAFDERLQSAANVTTDASNLERINRWTCAIEMFKERPVFGFGPGTFAFEYARFQEPENLTIISTNFGDMGNAHSEYLSALSESGLLGFIFFVSFVIGLFYYMIQFTIKARLVNHSYYILGCGMLFSLSTYFIHAVLNNFLDTDKAAVPIYGMLAIMFVLNKSLSAQPK